MNAAASAPGYDPRWQQVTCQSCRREYQCTPDEDYYPRDNRESVSGPDDGLCEECLVKHAGLAPSKTLTAWLVVNKEGRDGGERVDSSPAACCARDCITAIDDQVAQITDAEIEERLRETPAPRGV